MNLDKLPPAPWEVFKGGDTTWLYLYADDVNDPVFTAEHDDAEAETALRFAALARNAFDVMVRRGWRFSHSATDGFRWRVVNRFGDNGATKLPDEFCVAGDPFTALVIADEWYKTNVEAK